MARTMEASRLRPRRRPAVNVAGLTELSAREEQVLSYAAEGLLDKQIGHELGLSLNTLRTYWQRIRAKIGEAPRSALAVAYMEHVAAEAKKPQDADPEHDWELDLHEMTYRKTSDKPGPIDLANGEAIPFEDVASLFHPEDQARIRALIAAVRRGELSSFLFSARAVTLKGAEIVSAFIKVATDEEGHAAKLLGRRIPNIDLRPGAIERIQVGYWTRDLRTQEFTADEGFRKIFRIKPGEKDVRASAMKRFHPDEIGHCKTFVEESAKAGLRHARRTHRLVFEDGMTEWVTTDLRIEYEGDMAVRALGTVMAFL